MAFSKPSQNDITVELRDYFAAAALSGYLAAHSGESPWPSPERAAAAVYAFADAMLAERERTATNPENRP